jgi:hypothetical protein
MCLKVLRMSNSVAIARSRELVYLRVIVLYIRAAILWYAGSSVCEYSSMYYM